MLQNSQENTFHWKLNAGTCYFSRIYLALFCYNFLSQKLLIKRYHGDDEDHFNNVCYICRLKASVTIESEGYRLKLHKVLGQAKDPTDNFLTKPSD